MGSARFVRAKFPFFGGWKGSGRNSLERRHIENTIAKRAERHVGRVGKRHLQDSNVAEYRSANCGDEDEGTGREEEKGADMVEEASIIHGHGRYDIKEDHGTQYSRC
jgi:hypothetical protein